MIDGQTLLYGIIGNPVRHTLSPVIHNRAFKRMGLNAVYVPLEVHHLESAVKGIRGLGVAGVSVTIPFKVEVIQHLDDVDPMARRIQAVNTILNRNGKLVGYNTDWSGALAALDGKVDLQAKRVCLLGAGGAARAIGFGLRERRCSVVLVNRSALPGKRLADELGFEFRQWTQSSGAAPLDVDLLINATSVGMFPYHHASPVPTSLLKRGMLVMDIVYHPARTALLSHASENGCITIDGLEMLAHQGAGQLEIWTGKRPDAREILKDLRKALRDENDFPPAMGPHERGARP
jgi:shikimate dehydrogenase